MEKKYSLRFVLTLMLLASALTCIVIAAMTGLGFRIFGGEMESVNRYSALLSRIGQMYIGDYSEDEIADAAMHATVEALGDRWSYYMNAAEYNEYINYSNNRYVGIGVGVEIDGELGGLRIKHVYEGSAAEEAGIAQDDVVTALDGVDITGMDLDDITALMEKDIGETIVLTVIREGGELSITVVCGLIYYDPVSYEMLDGDIGYIILSNFDNGAADGFISAVDDLREKGAHSLIFDVRNNGGGRVSELTRILDYLLPEGEIFISVDKTGGERVTRSDEDSVELPAVVLVNSYSFSAAEYFAATLGEYDRADIVGERTTGKNRSQETVPLPGGGALHISSGEYLTKNRVSLAETDGLTPQYEINLTPMQFERLLYGALDKDDDPQLQKAIELTDTKR